MHERLRRFGFLWLTVAALSLQACVTFEVPPLEASLVIPPGAQVYAVLEAHRDPELWRIVAGPSGVPTDLAPRIGELILVHQTDGQTLILVQGDFPALFVDLALQDKQFRQVGLVGGHRIVATEAGLAITQVREGLMALSPAGPSALNAYWFWRGSQSGAAQSGAVSRLFSQRPPSTTVSILVDLSSQSNLNEFQCDLIPIAGTAKYRFQARLSGARPLDERQVRAAARLLVLQTLQSIGLEADLGTAVIRSSAAGVTIEGIELDRSALARALQGLVQGRGNQ